MLRINLLPSYVGQRRLNKKLIVIWTTVFACVVVIGLAAEFLYLRPQDARETALANAAVAAKAYLDSEAALAQSTIQSVAPVQANIDFFHAVQKYNSEYPNLYETVAEFTSPKILYTGMAVSGATLTIDAYTPSIEELGRYLQVMYHEPDFTSVSISAIPTPDQAAQKIYMYKGRVIGMSGGTLVSGTTSTTLPGIPPGVTVTLPAGLKLPTGPVTGQSAPGSLPALSPNLGLGSPSGLSAGSGAPSDVYSFILSEQDFNPKYFKVITRRTDGFTFVATCGLKTTFTPPAVPSGGAAAPAPGAPGSPGGQGG